MKRRIVLIKAAAFLSLGAVVLQTGGCLSIALNSGLAGFALSDFLDENERLFGIFAPCGTPNFQLIDENGIPQGTVENTDDDLIFFCPTDFILQDQGNNDDGGGGGG